MEQYAAEKCEINEYYCLPKIEQKCKSTPRPLDFVYDRKTDSYDLSQYASDLDLIRKVQSGKGDETFIYYGSKSLYIEMMFGGTVPKEPVQDYARGNNDLYAAKSARWVYQFE